MPLAPAPDRDAMLSEVEDQLGGDLGAGEVRSAVRVLADSEDGRSAPGVPTEGELGIINDRHALRPLTADQVYVFRNEISNDLVDSYFTQMDADTTLRNFADDFREGRSLQNSHTVVQVGLGRSFDAAVIEDSNPQRVAVAVKTYMLRGLNTTGLPTDDVIRGIDGGVIKDMSVRFTGGEYICSICGLDMWRDWDCEHWPGDTYSLDEGKSQQVCTARIQNAHASEQSLVFDGATPMAMVLKGQELVTRGVLKDQALARFERIYQCRMRNGVLIPRHADLRRTMEEPLLTVKTHATGRAAKTLDPAPSGDPLRGHIPLPTSRDEFLALDGLTKLRLYALARSLGFVLPDGAVAPLLDGAGDEARMWHARAEWTTAYVNDLPDRAFAYIESGGEKDEDGKTTPRSLRHFPHHDDEDKVDEPHVVNALSRIPQSDLSDDAKTKALNHVEAHAKALGIETDNEDRGMTPPPAADPTHTSTPAPVSARAIVDLVRLPKATRQTALRALLGTLNGECNRSLSDAVLGELVKRYGATISSDTAEQLNEIADHLADAGEIIEELLDATADAGGGDADDPDEADEDEPDGESKGRGQRNGGGDPVPVADAPPSPDPGRVPGSPVELRAVTRVLLDLTTEEGAPDGTPEQRSERRDALLAEVERRPDLAPLRAVMRQAADGRRLRSLLIDEAHEWGARARGNGYHRALYERMFAHASVDDVREVVREMEQEAYRRFANEHPGGTPEWTPSLAGQVGRASVPTDPYGPRRAVPTTATASPATAANLFKDQQPLRRV